jgi:hypothetical protein
VELKLHHSYPRHSMKMNCQLHAPVASPSGKTARFSLQKRSDWFQPSGRHGDEKDLSVAAKNRTSIPMLSSMCDDWAIPAWSRCKIIPFTLQPLFDLDIALPLPFVQGVPGGMCQTWGGCSLW